MIEVTPLAQEQALAHLEQADRQGYCLRVEIVGRSSEDFIYRLIFMPPEYRKQEDQEIELDGLRLLVDPLSARYLRGSTLDYLQSAEHQGFKVENPNPLWLDPAASRANEIIESQINPGIAMHGGRVTLLDVQDGVAYVSMAGGCQGCGLASVTLKQGVERSLREAVPEISQVVDTTEHALGTNPYYQSSESGTSPASSPLS